MSMRRSLGNDVSERALPPSGRALVTRAFQPAQRALGGGERGTVCEKGAMRDALPLLAPMHIAEVRVTLQQPMPHRPDLVERAREGLNALSSLCGLNAEYLVHSASILDLGGLQPHLDDAALMAVSPCLPHLMELRGLWLGRNKRLGVLAVTGGMSGLPKQNRSALPAAEHGPVTWGDGWRGLIDALLSPVSFGLNIRVDEGARTPRLANEMSNAEECRPPLCRRLYSLTLHYSGLDSEGLRLLLPALSKMSSLEMLSVHHNPLLTAGARLLKDAMAELASLRVLYLQHTGLGDAGVGAVAERGRLPLLEKLHLSCNGITDVGAQVMANALEQDEWGVNLEDLRMDGNVVSFEGKSYLRKGWGSRPAPQLLL